MTAYRICARSAAFLATDWREQLAERLGGRPRRIGRWAELGLQGALECLAAAGETVLAEQSVLVLSSRHGPAFAMREALAQASEGLPLPLTFLQIQPGQLLAALSAQLRWCGDARFICQPDPLVVLALALTIADSHAGGVLLGWVNELDADSGLRESSRWLRLEPVANPDGVWQDCADFETLMTRATYIRKNPSGLAVIIDR